MSSARLVVLAVATEGALAAAAWVVTRLINLPLPLGHVARDIVIGVAAAVVLSVINYALLTRAPSSWLVNGVRAVYHEVLVPVFGALHPIAIGIIGLAAGLGEELFFRGLLQPTLGWLAASVLFGLAHTGGREMLPFATWAAVMGGALGGLALVTGGLTAPVVAHGMYDVMALAFIRRARVERGSRRDDGGETVDS
jgi:membrane protease YdiL (CAAX protease family)